MKKIVSLLLLLFVGVVQAQQLNCSIQINADKVTNSNQQIFKKPDDIAFNIRLIDHYLKGHFPDYLFVSPLITIVRSAVTNL